MFSANTESPTPVVQSDAECPQITVRTGAASWSQAAGPGPTNVRYQGSLGQLARECALLGETMTVKVGVEGRILLGPKGSPGNVTVPIRIALVQEGPQPRPIWSKFYTVSASIPQGATQASFSQVEDDITFALPESKNLENYVIYVGFDPKGATPPPKSKAKPAPSRAQNNAAPAPKRSAPPPSSTSAPRPSGMQPSGSSSSFEPPPSNVFAPPPSR